MDRSEHPLTPKEIEIVRMGGHVVRYPQGDNKAKIKAVLEAISAITGGPMPTDQEIDAIIKQHNK